VGFSTGTLSAGLYTQSRDLTLYVPGIPKWDADCTTSGIPARVFRITKWITRDGLRARPEEYVGKLFFQKRQF
jgi:hypothetical protein